MSVFNNHQLRLALRWVWRLLWLGLVVVVVLWVFEKQIATWFGGRWEQRPEEISQLSPESMALVARSAEGIARGKLYDYGVYQLPADQALPGWKQPAQRIKALAWRTAAGLPQDGTVTEETYFNRLIRLQRGHPLLPVMLVHGRVAEPSGEAPSSGEPSKYPGAIIVVPSVDPMVEDVMAVVRALRNAGVRHLYLDASSFGIERFDESTENFVRALVNNGMTLVVQGSPKPSAEPAGASSVYLDPDALKPLLKRGINVVYAGVTNYRWPGPGQRQHSTVEKLAALVAQYPNRLYLDIGNLPYTPDGLGALEEVLQSITIHKNLAYSSQYPLPGFASRLPFDALVRGGFITADEATGLREIYQYNPLLMDFVLKRLVQLPHTIGESQVRFPVATFMALNQRPVLAVAEEPKPEQNDK